MFWPEGCVGVVACEKNKHDRFWLCCIVLSLWILAMKLFAPMTKEIDVKIFF